MQEKDITMASSAILLTEGNIKKKIITFALPIFWGNLFQQLYNIVDALVIGNSVGGTALAAVSSTGPLIFLLVGFFGGLFTGVGVTISRYFGAKDEENIQKSVSTAVGFGLIAGVCLSIVGFFLSPLILRLTNTPPSVMGDAKIYVQTYFCGIIFLVLYNTASGIFQAIGDSKHPLYYLIISSILNVVLDIIFVIYLGLGVGGAAIATVIAQAVSVAFAFHRLLRINAIYRVSIKNIHINWPILSQMLKIGLPAGMQNSIIAFANIFVQSNINTFDAAAMAGNGAYAKLEGFAFIPITSFSMALTTFVSQNIGANKPKRVREGARFGILTSLFLAELVGILFFIFAPFLISLFNTDPAIVAIGVRRAHICGLFYFLLSFSHSAAGILRGASKSIVPMIIMLLCWCLIRVTYITIITNYIPSISVIFAAYPITWFLSSLLFLLYYFKSPWIKNLCITSN